MSIGRNNGVVAEVANGLEPGDRVVLYPSTAITDGTSVSERMVE